MENLNTPDYLEKYKQQIFENLRQLQGAPSVALQDTPGDLYEDDEDSDGEDPDVRESQRMLDRRVEHDSEFYETSNGVK